MYYFLETTNWLGVPLEMDQTITATTPKSCRTVLLVDDDPKVREIIRRVLIKEGVRVVEAGHGAEAIEGFNRQPKGVDLLLTDIDMPGMSGLALSSELSKCEHRLKTVYVSGFPDLIANRGSHSGSAIPPEAVRYSGSLAKGPCALIRLSTIGSARVVSVREYAGVAADNDGWSRTLMFTCAGCHTDYFEIAESMSAEGSRSPFCLGPTVPTGYGFAGPNGQFYLGLRCHRCRRTAQVVYLRVCLPNRPERTAGVFLLDNSYENLYFRMRDDRPEIADQGDADVLSEMGMNFAGVSRSSAKAGVASFCPGWRSSSQT
jgi:hypothetical protein